MMAKVLGIWGIEDENDWTYEGRGLMDFRRLLLKALPAPISEARWERIDELWEDQRINPSYELADIYDRVRQETTSIVVVTEEGHNAWFVFCAGDPGAAAIHSALATAGYVEAPGEDILWDFAEAGEGVQLRAMSLNSGCHLAMTTTGKALYARMLFDEREDPGYISRFEKKTRRKILTPGVR